ncbi:restriction endonuclease subunit S [Microbacterium sp. NPDC089695]|uniref:restriction endonuclease subunit S n=1 Tax=Microbacterium sp. NPDC089695 TaxID=3364198 RepID=UPI00381DC838
MPIVGSFGVTGWHDEAKASGPGVAIGRSGASIGVATYVAQDYWPLNTALFVNDFRGNDERWVYWLLDLIDFSGYNSGSAQPSLNRNYLAQISVLLPPVDEQRRIADVLQAFEELIDADERLAIKSAELACALARKATGTVPLGELAQTPRLRVIMPEGATAHYSLPAFDERELPEIVAGDSIKSGKQLLVDPVVLVSRLNPHIPRVWMAYPSSGLACVASTEFVPIVPIDSVDGVRVEELYAVASAPEFAEQMRSQVTGTTGSHQRVDKSVISRLLVPDVRSLAGPVREAMVLLVRAAQASRDAAAELRRNREELLPALMSGQVHVVDIEELLR